MGVFLSWVINDVQNVFALILSEFNAVLTRVLSRYHKCNRNQLINHLHIPTEVRPLQAHQTSISQCSHRQMEYRWPSQNHS